MSESSAEDFLYEAGAIRHRSENRRQILGCIACRWNASRLQEMPPQFYGYQAVRCAGIKSGALYPVVEALEASGAMTSEYEDTAEQGSLGRPERRYYSPTDTVLGAVFEACLEAPEHCKLEDS